MELCIYCGATMATVEESRQHPFVCYGARKAFDEKHQSELTNVLKEMIKILKRIDKKLK